MVLVRWRTTTNRIYQGTPATNRLLQMPQVPLAVNGLRQQVQPEHLLGRRQPLPVNSRTINSAVVFIVTPSIS